MPSNFLARGIDFDDYFIKDSSAPVVPGYPQLHYKKGPSHKFPLGFGWRGVEAGVSFSLGWRWSIAPKHLARRPEVSGLVDALRCFIRKANAPLITLRPTYTAIKDPVTYKIETFWNLNYSGTIAPDAGEFATGTKVTAYDGQSLPNYHTITASLTTDTFLSDAFIEKAYVDVIEDSITINDWTYHQHVAETREWRADITSDLPGGPTPIAQRKRERVVVISTEMAARPEDAFAEEMITKQSSHKMRFSLVDPDYAAPDFAGVYPVNFGLEVDPSINGANAVGGAETYLYLDAADRHWVIVQRVGALLSNTLLNSTAIDSYYRHVASGQFNLPQGHTLQDYEIVIRPSQSSTYKVPFWFENVKHGSFNYMLSAGEHMVYARFGVTPRLKQSYSPSNMYVAMLGFPTYLGFPNQVNQNKIVVGLIHKTTRQLIEKSITLEYRATPETSLSSYRSPALTYYGIDPFESQQDGGINDQGVFSPPAVTQITDRIRVRIELVNGEFLVTSGKESGLNPVDTRMRVLSNLPPSGVMEVSRVHPFFKLVGSPNIPYANLDTNPLDIYFEPIDIQSHDCFYTDRIADANPQLTSIASFKSGQAAFRGPLVKLTNYATPGRWMPGGSVRAKGLLFRQALLQQPQVAYHVVRIEIGGIYGRDQIVVTAYEDVGSGLNTHRNWSEVPIRRIVAYAVPITDVEVKVEDLVILEEPYGTDKEQPVYGNNYRPLTVGISLQYSWTTQANSTNLSLSKLHMRFNLRVRRISTGIEDVYPVVVDTTVAPI